MGNLTIVTLGDPLIQHDAVPCTFTTRKALALTLYLAVTAQPHTRAHLIALLWPDADAAHGSANLRQTLGRIRQALGADADDHLLTPGDLVRLDLGAGGALDLTQVTTAIPATTAAALRLAALRCFQGSFCTSLTIDDAPDFMVWVQAQRAHWDACYDVLAEHEMSVCLANGQAEDAVPLGKSWVQLRPDTEVAYRLLATAQAAAGDVTGARLTLTDCAQVWANLALPLDPVTMRLQEQLQSLPASVPDSPTAHTIRLPFVGRQGAFDQLRRTYEGARAGKPHLALIEGEAGVGKSRLLGAFTQWATLQGADVVLGQAYEMSGRIPFQPLAELVRTRLAREHAPDDLLDDLWLTELSRLVPELRERYPDLPVPVDDAGAGARLSEALAQTGLALAQQHLVVWVIEDLHWADGATRDALTALLGRWQGEGVAILLVVTLRMEDRATSPELQRWVVAAERLVPVVPITLAALTTADSQHAAMKLLSDTASPALCAWLFAVTAGNPLYLEQVAQGLVERGAVVWQGATLRSTPDLDVGQLANWVPDTLRELLLRRVRYLDPVTQRVIAAAAVTGGRFTEDVVQAIARLDEEAVLTALEVAERRQLLRVEGGQYRFTHDKITEAVYSDLPLARRRVLHRRAYTVLEATRTATAAALAPHALHAGLLARAFQHYLAAGDAALAVSAGKDALAHYQEAEQILGQLTTNEMPSYGEQITLYDHFSDAYLLLHDIPNKLRSEQHLLRIAREAQDTLWVGLGRSYYTQSLLMLDPDSQQARDNYYEVNREKGMTPEAIPLEVEWSVAQFAATQEHWRHAEEGALRCLRQATALGFPEYGARSRYLLGQIAAMTGQWDEASRHLRESQAAYATLAEGAEASSVHPFTDEYHLFAFGDPQTDQAYRAVEADCWSTVSVVQLEQGEQEAALRSARKALEIARAIQSQTAEAMAANSLALGLVEGGWYEEALRYGVIAHTTPFWTTAVRLRLRLGWIDAAHRLGDIDAPLIGLRQIQGIFSEKQTLVRFLLMTRLCVNRLLAERWNDAAAIAQLTSRWRHHAQRPTLHAEIYRYREIEALLRGGDIATARQDVATFAQYMRHNQRYRLIGLRMQAKLGVYEGAFAAVSDCLQEARRIAEDLHLAGEHWQITAELAAVYRQQGEMVAAAEAEAHAQSMIAELAARIVEPSRRHAYFRMAQQEMRSLLSG